MLKLDLRRLCYEREVGSPNQFLKKCGISAHTATRLLGGRLNSINFKYLEIICLRLKCTIDDLFSYTPDEDNLHNDQPLNKLRRIKPKDSVSSKLPGLTLEKLDQVRDFINELEKPKKSDIQ